MKLYLNSALLACRVSNIEPSILLHPLDAIGGDQIPDLKFFPGMDVASEKKKELLIYVLESIAESYSLIPVGAHARSFIDRGGLEQRVPA